jgi:hypothetical protein
MTPLKGVTPDFDFLEGRKAILVSFVQHCLRSADYLSNSFIYIERIATASGLMLLRGR